MIASIATNVAIWMLSFGLVINAWHIYRVNKQLLALRQRVFELEMERDFPGFRRGDR